MASTPMSPLGAIVRGAIAGAVGTLTMDVVWYARYRRDGGAQSFLDWELSTSTDSYDEAAAPAEVGRRVAEDVLDVDVPERTAGTMNDVMHWATGLGYGTAHGLVSRAAGRARITDGLVTGPAAFANSYTVLPLMGIYEPLWDYDVETIYKDLSAHLAFGLATAATFRLLAAATDVADGSPAGA